MRLAHRVFTLALSAMVMFAAAAVARGDDTPAAEEKAAATETQIKVFKLKHRTLSDVQTFVSLLSKPGSAANFGLRVVPDAKSKNLFVRGPGDKVEVFSKVIAHIDVPAEQIAKGTLMNLVIIPLKGESSENALEILEGLGIEPLTLQLDKTKLLVLRGEGETADLKDIETVLEALGENADSERAAAE